MTREGSKKEQIVREIETRSELGWILSQPHFTMVSGTLGEGENLINIDCNRTAFQLECDPLDQWWVITDEKYHALSLPEKQTGGYVKGFFGRREYF